MTDREWTARVKRAEENARLLSKLPAMKCGYALRVEYTDLNEGLKELTRQFKAKYKTI